MFFPVPQGIFTFLCWYWPTAPSLNGPNDTFDSVNGWDELIALSAAIKMLTREESWDAVDRLKADYAAVKLRVQSMASKRDAGQSPRITNIYAGRREGRFIRRIS